MLNLPTLASTLQVVTGSPVVAVSVHASFLDLGPGTAVSLGDWKNSSIVLATTTTVVDPPPGAGIDRNVKFLSVNNASALPCNVTVQRFDGATAFVLFGPVNLLPAWSLHYNTDGDGFVLYDDVGRIQET